MYKTREYGDRDVGNYQMWGERTLGMKGNTKADQKNAVAIY